MKIIDTNNTPAAIGPYSQNMNDFSAFNEVYAKYFIGKPARSCVEVSALPKGALVEIEVVAIIGKGAKQI